MLTPSSRNCSLNSSVFGISNNEPFKTQRNSSGCRESARARVSGIYDVENGFMINALIADCAQGEKKLAKKI